MIFPFSEEPTEIMAHYPKKSVKGGQFKGGWDVYADGADFLSPCMGKIAHTYPSKTRCGVAVVPGLPGRVQFTISEEFLRNGDRHLTKVRIFVANLEPVPEMTAPGPVRAYRHVAATVKLGVVRRYVHMSSNRPEVLAELLGVV